MYGGTMSSPFTSCSQRSSGRSPAQPPIRSRSAFNMETTSVRKYNVLSFHFMQPEVKRPVSRTTSHPKQVSLGNMETINVRWYIVLSLRFMQPAWQYRTYFKYYFSSVTLIQLEIYLDLEIYCRQRKDFYSSLLWHVRQWHRHDLKLTYLYTC